VWASVEISELRLETQPIGGHLQSADRTPARFQQAHQDDKFKGLGRRSASRTGRALISSSSTAGSKMCMAASMWSRSDELAEVLLGVCSIWPAISARLA
jgi:hypothetical protein